MWNSATTRLRTGGGGGGGRQSIGLTGGWQALPSKQALQALLGTAPPLACAEEGEEGKERKACQAGVKPMLTLASQSQHLSAHRRQQPWHAFVKQGGRDSLGERAHVKMERRSDSRSSGARILCSTPTSCTPGEAPGAQPGAGRGAKHESMCCTQAHTALSRAPCIASVPRDGQGHQETVLYSTLFCCLSDQQCSVVQSAQTLVRARAKLLALPSGSSGRRYPSATAGSVRRCTSRRSRMMATSFEWISSRCTR